MTASADGALTCRKAAFSLDPDECWLDSAYMGPLPDRVRDAGMAAIAARAFPVGITAADFFEPAERVRGMLARLVGADPEHVAFVTTATSGFALLAKNLEPQAGANVVLLGDQFPSNVYPWRRWRGLGVELRMIDAPDGPLRSGDGRLGRAERWNDALVAAIDERTMLVSIEQAHWTDGTLFDLARIGARCRDVGAVFAVDATQTAGAMPIDVEALGIDVLVVHCYKSMLSSYGLGFVVLSERFADGRPLDEGWLVRAGSENFAGLVDYQDRYAAGMRRYDTSLRSNGMLIGMLGAACELLLEWQPARIRDYLLGIEAGFAERVAASGFEIAAPVDRAANLFGVRLPPGLAPAAVREALAARRIRVSVRGGSVRVAPHVFNDEADLARLAGALEALV